MRHEQAKGAEGPTWRSALASAGGWWIGMLSVALTSIAVAGLASLGLVTARSTTYIASVLAGLAGTAIVVRHPRNSVGWLMIATNLMVGIDLALLDYGDFVTRGGHNGFPLAVWVLWLGSWLWVPPFGLTVPAALVRLPEGHFRARWWFVDVLAVAGSVGLILALAFMPGPMYPRGLAANPVGIASARTAISVVYASSLALIAVAVGLGVASVVVKLRDARGDQAEQLKWITFASGTVAVTLAAGLGAVAVLHLDFLTALTPFYVAILGLPVAIAVAILRYGLYEIDLIINRALVYGSLTAILAGMYAGLVTFAQRLFTEFTGQKSDAAIVLTAFAVAAFFTPMREWLQKVVNRYVSPRNPNESLDQLSESLEAIVTIFDRNEVAGRLLKDAVASYDAEFGVLYLIAEGSERMILHIGSASGVPSLEIPIRFNGHQLGRLVLGHRKRAASYSRRHKESLQRSSDAVARILILVDRFARAPAVR